LLHVHRSERADGLVAGLADVLNDLPADPLAREVIAVPAKGVERWLMQRLSHRLGVSDGQQDGVCANVEFPHPSRLVAQVLSTAAQIQTDDDPWSPDQLVWAVLEVVDECVGQAWCATLNGHLGHDAASGGAHRARRLTTAQQLARLFDSYAEHRPAMIRGWAVGDDTDGAGGTIDADLAWQVELWRRVRSRIGVASPAERLPDACDQLRKDASLVDLPGRLSLFGPTRLTTAQLEVLSALGAQRDVHLWLPHPSAVLWDRIAAVVGEGSDRVHRRDDPTVEIPQNPLLSSLGRDTRELQLQLSQTAAQSHHHPIDRRPNTLLGDLQQSLHDDASMPDSRYVVDPKDRTVAVHSCHGPARQVEVLREVLVGLLADDPSLEPRDILVMCPNIEDYAPLISATFGLDDDDDVTRHPGHQLRVRLADRSLRQTNPLLATLSSLLELAVGRVTASQVLDLAASPAVRRRFRFDDDELERLQEWASSSGVRWGLDASHRQPYGLDGIPQNTWQAGLDRVLLGAAMAEDEVRWVGLALPLDDVDSTDIDLAGRFAELIDRLAMVLDGMSGNHALVDWLTTLETALDSLTAIRDADSWQSAQARRDLADVATNAGARAATTQLSIADVAALLGDHLEGRPSRSNFRTGGLTMCSMVPMRSVPHRVVCLLGLDDGMFPRSTTVNGDDVLARDPCIGERDPRGEDRQLLLDAILAAREHLVVLYTGADPRTNARRPPAVPVGEIVDAIDALATTADGKPASEHVVVHQPLQPFDARNFVAGALGAAGPFSFDIHALRGAERAAGARSVAGPLLTNVLDAMAPDDVALDDLVYFLEQPAKAFLRQRLGLTLVRDGAELDDAVPIDLDSLEKWAVGDRLLHERLRGAEAADTQQAEWRRGSLPPQQLGRRVLDSVGGEVEPLVTASATVRNGIGESIDISVNYGARQLTGTVANVHDGVLVRVEYSKLAPKHRLRAWAQLLALTAARPDQAWTAVTIGRGRRSAVARSTIGPLDPDNALRLLGELIDLRDRGLRYPLPLAVKASATYATRRVGGSPIEDALAAATRDWTGGQFDGENADEAHDLVWGTRADFARLLADAPLADEQGASWPAGETTRFGAVAVRLWSPLLAHEREDTS
jgi:exodeoxyribonuclease V gamma subunit